MAVLDGCVASKLTPILQEVKCPVCGELVEVFTKDGVINDTVKCDKCGYVFEEGKKLGR